MTDQEAARILWKQFYATVSSKGNPGEYLLAFPTGDGRFLNPLRATPEQFAERRHALIGHHRFYIPQTSRHPNARLL